MTKQRIEERIEQLKCELGINECTRDCARQNYEKEHDNYYFVNYLHYQEVVKHLQEEIEFLKSLIEGE